MICDMAL